MVTVDSAALGQVLDSVDLRVGVARRVSLTTGSLLPIAPRAATLVYIAAGSVTGHPPLTTGCRLDVDRSAQIVAVDDRPLGASLVAGDAFLTLGRTAIALEAESDADLVVVDLEFSDSASMLAALLPDPITVMSFAALEPAAAALAGSMGPTDPPSWPVRQGDPVICRMMAKTVLLSVIRAWAANGCAPDGWPSVSQDPFLDRVVEAIHEQPGRDWTVERLASVGAMSRSVFAERFRTAIGRSPADYVTEVRVDAAKRMLSAGRSVSETSRELGYASDEGFSRAFRRRTGLTPSAWRASELTPVPA
ncbi:helix-turn-helix transcriptional regulator [Microbacterium sp. ISL-103]|uniref:helix-turn-helix domain-containing protein n=1 Tax=Microbacterium sp. ISL-103 TaxID=2819156 RepID=UPI001BE8D47B|nr:AraC family transcriptional regulator [Microbacterium sp. ISL-103]MBT2474986.1 helix-turn-helix transcriptional regulator [Microbacterium sp. ISL-103]